MPPRRVVLVAVVIAAVTAGAVLAWRLTHSGTARRTVLTASGGAVQLSTRARLEIAPGALDRDTVVTMAQVTDLPPASHENMFVPGRGYEVDVGDARILRPMTLTLAYDGSEIPAGVSEQEVDVAVWDEGQWHELPGQVDLEANTVSVEIRHLTLYTWVTALLAPQHHRTEHFDVKYWADGPWALRPPTYAQRGDTSVETAVRIAQAAEAVRAKLREDGYRFPDYVVRIKLCAVLQDNPAEAKTQWAVRNYVKVNHDIEGMSQDPRLKGLSYDALIEGLVSHELFHLSQAEYREHEAWTPGWVADRDLWWREATATWFMTRFAPAYGFPALEPNSVNLFFSLNDLGNKYANASFVSYLAHKHGAEIVRDVWEAYAADHSDQTCLSAIDATLQAHGASLSANFVEYAAHFAVLRDWDDAREWEFMEPYTSDSVLTVEACEEGAEEQAGRKVFLLPLAAWPIKLVPRGSGTLHLSVSAGGEPPSSEWEAVVLTHGRRGWGIHSRIVPGRKALDMEGFGDHVRQVAVVLASTRWTGETQKVSVSAACTTKREPFAEAKRALRRIVDALERWYHDCGMYPLELTDLLRTDEPSYCRELREMGEKHWRGPYLPGGALPVNPFTGGRTSGRDWQYFHLNNVRVMLDMPYEPGGRLFARWSSFGWAPAGEVAGYEYFDRSGRRTE